ncbi:MAG: Ig domain-containing protein [Paludibacteraceae bacterium]
MKKLTLFLAAAMLSSMSFATTFEKVTAEPADWTGEYLLVYENSETEAYVWTGIDAASNYSVATIADGAIEVADAVTIEIAAMTGGYSVLVNGGTNDGKYIYGTSNNNKLNFEKSPVVNTLAYTDSHVVMTSGEIMVFNTTSGQTRFRYYKSATINGSTGASYKYPQLYKKVAGAEVPATAITLDATTWSAEQYKSTKLTATLTPAEATTEVVWTSSDENVATVANGTVTAVGVGTATITATAGVGVEATCAVTISAPTILTCAQAAEKAGSVSADNEVVPNGKYVVRGYVIKYQTSKTVEEDFASYGNYSFWMADTKDATEGTFEAYQVAPKDGATIVAVGDYVEVVGDLTKYGTTPETVGKGTATVEKLANPTTAIDNATLSTPSVKTIENGQLVIIRDGVKYNAMGIQL